MSREVASLPVIHIPGCPGHLGKYPDCLTAALHQAYGACVGNATEEHGDVEFRGYHWLVIEDQEVTVKADEWDGGVDVVAGPLCAVITEASDGSATLTEYATEGLAREAYEALEYAYGQWCDLMDVQPYDIVLAAGRLK